MQQYIPKDLADKIRSLGHHLESERRHVTVVFADISGFTAMSEQLDAEEVTQVINACFKALVEVVFRYEGTIDKFIGDEIMALFGAPIAHENDPERAIRAALEMQARLAEFNLTLATPLPRPLTLHVGINSGEVIAGNVGSDLRMDYSVLGDTVNLAARLEGASPSGQIWVSERSYALTRHLFEFKALRPFKVQGKQHKVQAYQVLGVKAVPERGRGVAEGYGPLVGRQEELAQLGALVETVQHGQGRVLGVVGEAGIGKSRLVWELQQLAEGFGIASGACVSYEVPAPYQVFTEVLRSLLRVGAEDEEGVVRQKLEAWVAAHRLAREAVLAPLGSLFGLRDEGWLYLADAEKLGRLQEALIAVLRVAAAQQPLLLVFEDLHWVDPDSGHLLGLLIPEVGALPLLLCCVYRTEFQPSWQNAPTCLILSVGSLAAEQTVALSEGLLKLDLPPELERLIVSRSEGNPFFVEELLKALLDEGVITRTRSGYALQGDVSALRLPDTMQGVILARLDRLEAQARETLQFAAVIGRRFSHALLEAVSPRTAQVEGHLQQLQSLGLVYQHRILPDLEYIFKHFVIREVAYQNLLVKRRRAIHLEVAKAIERLYRDRLEDYYQVLAHHFEAGEDWQKAADYYGKAGSRAREVHTDGGADALLERKDRAIQKVFERREGYPTTRVLALALYVVLSVLFTVGWVDDLLSGRFENVTDGEVRGYKLWVKLVFTLCLVLLPTIRAVRRSRRMTAVTAYGDRLAIDTGHKRVEVLFANILRLRWDRRSAGHMVGTALFGGYRVRTALRELYFGLDNTLAITARPEGQPPEPMLLPVAEWLAEGGEDLNGDGTVDEADYAIYCARWAARGVELGGDTQELQRLSIAAEGAGDLYRELRLAMTRWASARGRDLGPVFISTAAPLESHHYVSLRQADGTTVRPVSYEQLVADLATGRARAGDLVAALGSDDWVTVSSAARGDRRLWAALHPVWYGLRIALGTPKVWVLWAVLALLLLLEPRGRYSVATPLVPVLSVVLSAGLLVFLGVGLAEWARRLPLSGRQTRALHGAISTVVLAGIVASLVALNRISPRHTRQPSYRQAQAVPLSGIRVDGNLDDWPPGIAHDLVDISSQSRAGPATASDLNANVDLHARFQAGYDPHQSLLYLAVLVQDDTQQVAGSGPSSTDACEIYLDGDRSGGRSSFLWEALGATGRMAALKYTGIPGGGSWGTRYRGNPSLYTGDIGRTRTQMAYSRHGDLTTYEWAVEAFDEYPHAPTRLTPGKVIGFNIVVVDKDGQQDAPARASWGPFTAKLHLDAWRLSDLVLATQGDRDDTAQATNSAR